MDNSDDKTVKNNNYVVDMNHYGGETILPRGLDIPSVHHEHISPTNYGCNGTDIRKMAQLDLDFTDSGANRRSRHFAISDTSDLTSPQETVYTTNSFADVSLDLEEADNHSRRSKRETVSMSTNSSSTSSLLRQNSKFEFQLTSSSKDIDGEIPIRIYPSKGTEVKTVPQKNEQKPQETNICILSSLAENNNDTVQKQERIQIKSVQCNRNQSQTDKKLKHIRIPRDSSIRKFARQLSGKKNDYDVTDNVQVGVLGVRKRPKSYFDLAIVTMCCCVSVIGFAAVIMSVLSESNYKSKHFVKAKKYGKISMILSIVGMITTVVLAITLLLTLAYPWNQIVDL